MSSFGASRIYAVAFLIVVIPASLGHAADNRAGAKAPPQPGPAGIRGKISWSCDEIRQLVERIDREKSDAVKRGELDPRDCGQRLIDALQQSLTKEYSKTQLRQLAASFNSAPAKRDGWTTHQLILRDSLLYVLFDDGDREGVVIFLSVQCFQEVWYKNDIEGLLVGCKNLKDPILILGDAYDKSRRPETRCDIAGALRRGLRTQSIGGRDDAEFVKNAMAWYRLHRGELVFNERYRDNLILSGTFLGVDFYMENPLFVRKAEGKKKPIATEAGEPGPNDLLPPK